MKIFPAVHYSMGGIWVDYERTAEGGLQSGSPRNQVTNIPGLFAVGECDYQYHGGNRLGANALLSCIFSGLFAAPGIKNLLDSQHGTAGDLPSSLFEAEVRKHQQEHDALLARDSGNENPYLIHQELGEVMTSAATVVRRNDQLREAYNTVSELQDRASQCGLSDTGNWTNQNVVFTKALMDMFPLAKTMLKGALLRDECRGAHYKPDFALPSLTAEDPAERRQEAVRWCERFEANTQQWLKSTIATWDGNEPQITYEEVDTSIIPPRPRLYGLVGADVIEEVWKERQAKRQETEGENGASVSHGAAAAVQS
jgi:succinate dehydrogenase / fumarate reductase flavoprotein subunit